MKTWEKIFLTFSLTWVVVVYAFHYTGMLKGILEFHPNLITRIREILF